MINKIVHRSMQKKIGLIIAISILIIISSVMVGLNYFTYGSMDTNYTKMTENSNVEDFRAYKINAFSGEYDVSLVQKIESELQVVLEDKSYIHYDSKDENDIVYDITRFNSDDHINTFSLDEGNYPNNKNEVVVQPRYLVENNLEIGDSLTINNVDYKISGTGYFVEYVYPADMLNGMITPDFTSYAPVYMNQESYDDIEVDNKVFNQTNYYSGLFNNELNDPQQKDLYTSFEEDYTIDIPIVDEKGLPQFDSQGNVITEAQSLFPVILDYDTNYMLSSVQAEIASNGSTFTVLSIILTIMTIFLAIILINSVFKSQRREMGILKAEGVSLNKLTLGFGAYITLIVVINSVIGAMLSIPASNGLRGLYNSMYSLPSYPLDDTVILKVITVLLITAILIIILVLIISVRRNLNQKTLNLIKNVDSEKLPKHNISKLFGKLNFVYKTQLAILFRNWSKSLLLFFGVGVSAFLLLLGTLMYSSINTMMNGTYTSVFTYKYDAKLSSGETIKQNDNTYISTSATIETIPSEAEVKEDASISIMSYSYENNEFINLRNEDKNLLSDTSGATITDGLKKQYNLEIGDVVTLVNPYDLDTTFDVEIVGVTNDYFVPTMYIDIDRLQELLEIDSEYANGVVGNGDYDYIFDIDENANVSESIDMKVAMEDSMGMLLASIGIITVLASIIAYICLTAITGVIIDSNSKTISVMKVLGYSNREITKMTVGIYKWFVIFIYVSMMPLLELLIQTVVNVAMADMDFSIPININYLIGSLGLVVIYIIYMLSYKTSMRKINKISLAESLKADE